MRNITGWLIAFLLIIAMLGSILVLPGCDDDDDDTDTGAATTDGDNKAQYTLRYAHAISEKSTQGVAANKLVQLLTDYTDGRVEVELYPNGTLYGDTQLVQACQNGDVEIISLSSYFLANQTPYLLFSFLNGFWEDFEHAIRFNTSPELLAKLSADMEKSGIHILGGLPVMGMSSIWVTKNKELTRLKDAEGVRIASYAGRPETNINAWVGVQGVEVDATEMLTGFQTGMFDIYGTNLSSAISLKVWDMEAHHALVNPRGGNMSVVFAMNKKAWDKLSPDIQEIINNKVLPEFMDFCNQRAQASEVEDLETLRTHLDTLHLVTDEENNQMFAETTDNSMTKMFKGMAGDMWDLADSLRPSRD